MLVSEPWRRNKLLIQLVILNKISRFQDFILETAQVPHMWETSAIHFHIYLQKQSRFEKEYWETVK